MKNENDYEYLKKSNYELSDIIFQYVTVSYDSYKALHDYGTGELYTLVEVHTVTKIEENPGITITEIAQQNSRTKGAISQIVTRLEKKQLVRKEKDPNNAKTIHLFVTEAGLELSKCHKQYDEWAAEPLFQDMVALFGPDAVDKYFRIAEYITRFYKKNANNQNNKNLAAHISDMT